MKLFERVKNSGALRELKIIKVEKDFKNLSFSNRVYEFKNNELFNKFVNFIINNKLSDLDKFKILINYKNIKYPIFERDDSYYSLPCLISMSDKKDLTSKKLKTKLFYKEIKSYLSIFKESEFYNREKWVSFLFENLKIFQEDIISRFSKFIDRGVGREWVYGFVPLHKSHFMILENPYKVSELMINISDVLLNKERVIIDLESFGIKHLSYGIKIRYLKKEPDTCLFVRADIKDIISLDSGYSSIKELFFSKVEVLGIQKIGSEFKRNNIILYDNI